MTKDFQETLHEVLKTKLNAKNKQELLLQEILEKEENSNGFQEMLKDNVKSLSEQYFEKQLKDEKDKKLDKPKEINIESSLESIDKDLDKDENKEEIKQEKTSDTLTKREETLKHMYSAALDEYYNLRNKLLNEQLKYNNIALDDKSYLKLLQYENYLRKCDTLFKTSYGSYISNQDDELAKKENKYVYNAAKSGKAIMKEHTERVEEIDNLNSEIESKADEIIKLNEDASLGNIENYEIKLESLEKEYVNLNSEMTLLKPNILELHRQEEEKKLQDDTTTRVVGTMYNKRKEKQVYSTHVNEVNKKLENKEDKFKDIATQEKQQFDNTNIKLANSYIDSAEKALEKNNTEEARVLVSKAKDLVGASKLEGITSERKCDFQETLKENVKGAEVKQSSIKNETELIDNHYYNNENLTPIQKECKKAVYSPEERNKRVLKSNKEKEINIIELIR